MYRDKIIIIPFKTPNTLFFLLLSIVIMATLREANDSYNSIRHYPRFLIACLYCYWCAKTQLGVPTKLTSQPLNSFLLVLRIPTRSGWNSI